MKRIAVIMAGGSGERFWPVSRKLRPKQLLRLASPDQSLIEQTVDRVAPLVGQENIWIAAAPHLVEPMASALSGSVQARQILAEPYKRNTAGCMVWLAAQLIAQGLDECSMGVIAADHRITPAEGFQQTMSAALTLAEETGGLVTMGIRPDRPETGYGYIESTPDTAQIIDGITLHRVVQFKEKPDLATAQSYVESGRYLWNSGSFFWTLKGFLDELAQAAPDLHEAVLSLADLLKRNEIEAAHDRFEALPNISIDFALMEKANQVYVAEAAFDWDDVGAWDALERSLVTDDAGNVFQGEALALDCSGSIFYNDTETQILTAVGMEDVVVVATADAILVLPKSRAQDVKKIVETLRASGNSRD